MRGSSVTNFLSNPSARIHKQKKGRPVQPLLPFAPLIPWLEKRGEDDADSLLHLPATTRTMRRAIQQGWETGVIGVFPADEIAIDLFGVHPMRIWGADWFTVPDDEQKQARLQAMMRKEGAA